MLYEHWSDVPSSLWTFKYFKPYEIACKGTNEVLVNMEAMAALDSFRSLLNSSINLSSAYRSPYHNAKVGGAPRSSHLKGHAFDVRLNGYDKGILRELAERVGFSGFGMRYNTFIHIDMGRRREW
tara:strand:+ start:161 stop:535 length:375 start_codon:yes stop_codon:yes gene_type:complete